LRLYASTRARAIVTSLRALTLIALASFIAAGLVLGQNKVLSQADKEAIVREAGQHLIDRYVFPEVGQKCAQHLTNQLEAGAYDSVTDADQFARLLTEQMYSITRDRHLRVGARRRIGATTDQDDPFLRAFREKRFLEEENFGLAKVEMLNGNVGYLDIRWFPPIEATRATASAAMRFVAHVDALIIDLRSNSGGSPGTIRYICSYFFAERTLLNSLHWREGDRTEEFWTLDAVDGPKMPDVPIIVLTSKRTFSGGEEFAYNLKTRRRATLIGETTGGGANPGGSFPLPAGLAIFVPTGRAINPVTGTNWEGTGVEPDVPCVADSALSRALGIAVTMAQERRDQVNRSANETSRRVRSGLEEAETHFLARDSTKGNAAIRGALETALTEGLADESGVNNLGYAYLGEKKFELAIAVFSYNVDRYPDSWNTYDSLAEAYMTKGEKDLAIKYYRRSLELNPGNEGAKANIKKMGG
jgi:hypothetical protein